LGQYLPSSNTDFRDYLNSNEPLALSLRGLAQANTPQNRSEAAKTLLRIMRPGQMKSWDQDLIKNAADWEVFSAWIQELGFVPTVEIAEPNQIHALWQHLQFNGLKEAKLLAPAVLLNFRSTRGWLGFLDDRLGHPQSPFELFRNVMDKFLRRGLMQFKSAA
jgi:hypothetical protein